MRKEWLLLLILVGCDDGGSDGGDGGVETDAAVGQGDAAVAAGDGGVEGDGAVEGDAAPLPDPNPPMGCAQDVTCGGDPTGVWAWVAWCRVETAEAPEECPDAELGSVIEPDGTVDLRADGTFVVVATYHVRNTLRMPMDCVAGAACPILGAELDPDDPWDCVADGEVCDCERTQVLDGATEGTWSADGAVVTIDDADGTRPLHFCVEGDALHLLDVGADGEDPLFVLQR